MLESAHLTYGDQVLFIGVDSRDERGAALRFLANVGTTYPQVFDANARFAASLGTMGIPYTVIVDASGSVVYRQFGTTTAETLRAALANAGVTVATPDSGASRSPLVQIFRRSSDRAMPPQSALDGRDRPLTTPALRLAVMR